MKQNKQNKDESIITLISCSYCDFNEYHNQIFQGKSVYNDTHVYVCLLCMGKRGKDVMKDSNTAINNEQIITR